MKLFLNFTVNSIIKGYCNTSIGEPETLTSDEFYIDLLLYDFVYQDKKYIFIVVVIFQNIK